MPIWYGTNTGTTTTGTCCSNMSWVTTTSSATNTTSGIDIWDYGYRSSGSGYAGNAVPYHAQAINPRHAQERAVRQQETAVRAHSNEAQQRARELLLSMLTPEQRETFERNKWFVVEGGKTKNKYRINDKGHVAANIDVLDKNDKITHRICGHARIDAVPLGDQLLAQKLMLEASEEEFLKLANRHAA